MMTTVFQDVNPACIGDASTGPLLAVVVSAPGFDIRREFQTFKDAYGFPSAIEPEHDEYGETGPGIVTEEHAAATSAAVDRVMADVRGPLADDADLPNGWSSYPGVAVLFIAWLAQRPEIVVETALHHFTMPIYRSTVPTWVLEDDGDLYEEDAIGFDSDRGVVVSAVSAVSAHAVFVSDHDKAVCGVRISDRPERVVAAAPMNITCDVCGLRVLRSLQQENPTVPVSELIDFPMPSRVWSPG